MWPQPEKPSPKNGGNYFCHQNIDIGFSAQLVTPVIVMLSYDNNPIDKDQCFYCFRTPFDADGIYVSPKSHRSFCHAHLATHRQFSPDDTLYVQIRKSKKKIEDRPEKMIKLEIKQETESELYDVESKLFSYDGSLHELTPSKEELVVMDRIVKSDSSARKQEMKTWTQEYKPCVHTHHFAQSPIPEIQLEHCAQCELDQNLWICLTCGSLGCGRAQFGGVPGNTHALAHYKEAGHPIAVKLGSLSKDVMDVYCYQCDEEISFPGAVGALSSFGINLDTFQKTEKSLVELQLEQNLKWEFNMLNEQGESLPPVFGAELTGLKNLGNSCYLSSVMQALFSLPEYKKIAQVPLEDLKEEDGFKFQMVKLAKGLLSGEFSVPNEEGYQVGISPQSFKHLIGANHEEFSSMKQQDAFEFWNYLLDKIDNTLDADLNDIFRFVSVEKFKFPNNEVRLKKQVTENLTLQAAIELDHVDDKGVKHYKRQDFIDSLLQYLSPEEVDWEGSLKVQKSSHLMSFPKYLVTAIQRITLENWTPIKTDVPLTLPESFNIADFQPEDLLEDGEVEKKEEEDGDTEDFTPNMEAFNQLLQMGFPELRAKKALYVTGNTNMDDAMNWLFGHMDDPTIDDPIEFKKKSASASSVDESQISNLQDMGFSYQLAKKALVVNKGDANAAVEWLFSNPEDDGVLPPEPASPAEKMDALIERDGRPAEYTLKAVVCHKGTQVTSGHYVAFIRKADRWILFNDEKVVDATGDSKSWEEIEKNGYVYVWEKQ